MARYSRFAAFAASLLLLPASGASNDTSLASLCTTSNIEAALPANGTLLRLEFFPASVSAQALYNVSTSVGGGMRKRQAGPSSSTTDSETYSYCSANITYAHAGRGDSVTLKLAFPDPQTYKNRFYVAGGGGFSLSSDATGGLEYGAAGAATSAGYDAFDNSYDEIVLQGNGSIDWDATYAFGYVALGEMTKIAKHITRELYNDEKLFTYYEGCSDGGREGMSQVQRWGDEYDGAITGAPAFRFAQQQVHHVFSSAVEHTMDYYPPPCALEKIVNVTIAKCDPLDGRTDGVISRTDLCKLNFNLTSIIGEPYACAAETSSSLGFGFSGGGAKRDLSKRQQTTGSTSSYTPAQNGTVTAKDVAVAQQIYDGLHDLAGNRAYLSWQIGSELSDASTTWDNATSSWKLSIPSTGGEYVTKFIQLVDLDNLSNLDGVTYDTLVEWMNIGFIRYYDSLQTTIPDLTAFQQSGGKLLHYHGESDPSVPAASSVHYWQSVQSIMHQSTEELADWYQFYLVPGAAHCGVNSLQPGPYPEDNMQTMIDWVENGIKPSRLNATVSSGTNEGETQMLCQWPQRPLWSGNSSAFDCVFDEASYQSWTYEFPAFKLPVY